MHGTLMIAGALTLAAGLLTAVVIVIAPASGVEATSWWIPAAYVVSGLFGSLAWFALGGIVRRLDELQEHLNRPPS